MSTFESLSREVEELKREVEELRKDKRRLDWLNKQDRSPNWHTSHWEIESKQTDIRSAIDEKMF